MTAALSPAELDEVTRFGIHIPDIIRDMGDRYEETPTCLKCDAPAVVTTRKVCCSNPVSLCPAHFASLQAWVAAKLPIGIECTRCSATFHTPQTFEDMFRVVTL